MNNVETDKYTIGLLEFENEKLLKENERVLKENEYLRYIIQECFSKVIVLENSNEDAGILPEYVEMKTGIFELGLFLRQEGHKLRQLDGC